MEEEEEEHLQHVYTFVTRFPPKYRPELCTVLVVGNNFVSTL